MKKWLFNPFETIAGWPALLAGAGIILLTALVAFYGHIHLDGVIDLHVNNHVTFTNCLLEGAMDWLCISALMYLSGLIFSGSSIRLLDVAGTQALARFPMLISCLASLLWFNPDILSYIDYKFLHTGEAVSIGISDVIVFSLLLLVLLLMLVWQILLMYRAYSVSCNVKGIKGVISFTVGLLVAEILSKVLIGFI